MKKKILALAMAALMLIMAVVGGTLAYFTDDDQNTNEFTIGSVKIDLYETVGHTDGKNKIYIQEKDVGNGDDTNPNVKYNDIQPGHVMKKIAHVKNTGKSTAYVALVIKQENYLNFNQNVDEYYESNNAHTYNEDTWKKMGIVLDDTVPYENNSVMQKITDDVFPGWNLLYDKTQLTGNAKVRYTIDTLPTPTGNGVEVLGVGYAQANQDMNGAPQYHYVGKYFTNDVGMKTQIDGEPNFFSISEDDAHDRMWIVYLKLEPAAVFDMDLTTVCPTYFDNNSTNAFENMVLDVKAFAIQASGFEDEKAAFAEVLKAEDCFAY